MAETARLFVVAGEPSGDRLGADLVERLSRQRPVDVMGIGGPYLAAAGLRSLFPMSDLSVMGLNDVLRRLPLLLWRIRQTRNAILRAQPDLVVLVDSQVFAATVAKQLRARGYTKPILLYVSPTVWAWKPERALEIKPLFNEVLAILPFEPFVMRRLGGPVTTYVGHPAIAATEFRTSQPSKGPVLLLPGSRTGELRRHLPVILAAAEGLSGSEGVTGFVLPTPPSQEARVRAAVAGWPVQVAVTTNDAAKREAFAQAIAAVAVVGTVTLELALAGVPMVATYVADAAQVKRATKYKVPHWALPNILSPNEIVPEFVSGAAQPAEVTAALQSLVASSSRIAKQRDGFKALRSRMETGDPDDPVTDPLDRVVRYLP